MSSDDDDEGASSGDTESQILKKLDLRVKEVMSPNPLTISEDTTVADAARALEKQDSSCALIERDGEIVGMITERDITRRVVAKGVLPETTKVASVMTSQIIVTSPDTNIEEALKVMTANRVRRLPVVDEKSGLVGLVRVADIARALSEKAGYSTSLIMAMTKETPPRSGVYG
jgi:CBS domain-containing protein